MTFSPCEFSAPGLSRPGTFSPWFDTLWIDRPGEVFRETFFLRELSEKNAPKVERAS
jgi:hypothetical protein